MKSAAQGLITLATYGVGMLVGFYITGLITAKNLINVVEETTANGEIEVVKYYDWNQIWIFPAIFAGAVLLLFAFLFKNEKIEYKEQQ